MWFSRLGEILSVRVLSTNDQVEFSGWFSNDLNDTSLVTHIKEFEANGKVLDYQDVNSPICAMASFIPDDGAGNGGVTSTTIPQSVQLAIDSAWG